jgi:SAM-dependent methyltransferase
MSTDIRGCRLCGTPLKHTAVDLGLSPLCQNIVDREGLNRGEMFYPLRAFVCDNCWLIQVHELVSGEDIYSHYAYFSSYSDSWLQHASDYCDMIVQRLELGKQSQVVELASNDGYLLKFFQQKGVPALGIEPAANVAQVAIDQGLDCVVRFFGVETAKELVAAGTKADLLLGNNVIGHVPDLNDFVAGMKVLLAERGTITIEIPHAINLILENQFDTIYQEHYSYFLLTAMREVFRRHGMVVFDVDEIPTHGGSLRYYARHVEDSSRPVTARVEEIAQRESDQGLTDLKTYQDYARRVAETKWNLL